MGRRVVRSLVAVVGLVLLCALRAAGGDGDAGDADDADAIDQLPSPFQLASLDGDNGFRIDGAAVGDMLGGSVSGAGDVNGDGFADMIVGARDADPGGRVDAGRAYVIFGGASVGGEDGVVDLARDALAGVVRFDGIDAEDRSGYSVSGAGDVNGDGYADLVIGAPRANVGADGEPGEAYVIFGGPELGGPDRVFDLATELTATTGVRIAGIAPADGCGVSVSGADDVNGDGYADILIGAWFADTAGATDAGQAYLIYGGTSLAGGDGVLDLASELTAATGVRFDGVWSGDHAGCSVSGAGDVNGDGYADMLIGARGTDFTSFEDGGEEAGEAYVVYGGSSISGASGVFDLVAVRTGNGARIGGRVKEHGLGYCVAGAGDTDADGFADVMVGASNARRWGSYTAAIVYGCERFRGGEGEFDPVFWFTDHAVTGLGWVGSSAGYAVANAGDVNGDGFSDGLVGGRGKTAEPGRVSLAYGGESTSWRERGVVEIRGVAFDDRAGSSVSGVGDVNGDGFSDFAIGAPRADASGRREAGQAYVVFGSGGSTQTATVRVRDRRGDPPRHAVGVAGDGSDDDTPIARAWIDWRDGTGGSETRVSLFRDTSRLRGLPNDLTPLEAAGGFWLILSNRQEWTEVDVTLACLPSVMGGAIEADVRVYRADERRGPWARVDGVMVGERNRVSFTTGRLGYFAIVR